MGDSTVSIHLDGKVFSPEAKEQLILGNFFNVFVELWVHMFQEFFADFCFKEEREWGLRPHTQPHLLLLPPASTVCSFLWDGETGTGHGREHVPKIAYV